MAHFTTFRGIGVDDPTVTIIFDVIHNEKDGSDVVAHAVVRHVDYTCPFPLPPIPNIDIPFFKVGAKVHNNGVFSMKKNTAITQASLVGDISGSKAHGHLSAIYGISGFSCASGRVDWEATAE